MRFDSLHQCCPQRMDDNVTTHLSIPATIEELKATAEHLRNENADLRASALLWKRLYEQSLSGDAAVELACIRPMPNAPPNQTSYDVFQIGPLRMCASNGQWGIR